ncbi:hypothetical protein OHC33_005874 [Knufia fluminis]|uniref:Uncharacterized protein n=1 Tax=Knufia fluminis TaxID=191047 RepID=A0AAN8F8J9_9EURO|nr:hypothetical protein OHC33_005874 [Knufia fluminis]
MVRDDARWLKIAENIVKFKPARRLLPSDSIDDETRAASLDEALDGSSTSTHAISVSSGSPPSPSPRELREPQLERALSAASPQVRSKTGKRAANADAVVDSSNSKRTKRTSFPRAKKGLNPAFRNPIAGYLRTSKEAEETPRPRTAPEATVLVPFTTSPKARRAFSESTSSLSARGLDSFVEPLSNSRVDETSFMNDSPEVSESLEVRPLQMPSTRSEHSSFEKHRFPGNQEQLLPGEDFQHAAYENADMSHRFPQASFCESELEMGTRRVGLGSSFTNRSFENSVGDGARLSVPTPSTETASDPTRYLNNSSPLAQRSASVPTPVVDLTTDFDQATPQVTRRDVLGPVSSPLRGYDPSSEASEAMPSNEAHLAAVRALPKRIRCRQSNTVSKPFTTFLPDYLRSLGERFDLVNHFHPVLAPASIQASTRGYWRLLIKIAETGVVVRARRPPLTSSQWSDKRFMLRQEGQIAEAASTSEGDAALEKLMYPCIDPASHVAWTLDEFTEFWGYLSKVIERGRAGYDVRATIGDHVEYQRDGLLLEARLWCYAETLSHIWLVLYGVSCGLTARMPLQWFGAGEGALITMSGQPKRGGSIGRWVERLEGAERSWGIEDTWEGIETHAPVDRVHR